MERKLLSSLLCFLLCITVGRAQILEDFETEPLNQQFFTSNSQVFNVTTQTGGTFQIYSVAPGYGWNGTGADDRYIDNFTSKLNNVPFGLTISSAGSVPFVLKSFYGYLANYQDALNVTGSLTVVGKLGGVTQFTATASTGFVTTLSVQNGFTYINMATYGGSNNSNKAVDQLVLTSTNNYHYIAIDAFKWAPAFTVTSSVTNVSCNGGSNGAASVTPSGGTAPYTYSWAPAGGTAATATGLTAGNYTCTVTDAASVTYAKAVTVIQPSAITSSVTSQTNIACNGGTTGAATITSSGGTGTKTYSWAPSGGTATTATGLAAGVYTVTITDANACTRTQNVSITQPTAITATTLQTNISCNGGANGSATVSPSGGAFIPPAYTYSWAPSGGTAATASGLIAGTYTVTITDINSCSITKNITITQPPAITSSVTSQTNIACNGGTTGAATITSGGGTGTKTYSWAPSGGTAVSATGLAAGVYTVTITDANTCTKTQNVSLTQPTVITATTSQTNVACNAGTSGSATVTPIGGTPSYTYSWAPSGGTAATASGLGAGTYTVTITDANACSITKNVTITQPTAITATTSQTNISCNGGANGSATVTPSGGAFIPPAYTYSWAPSGGTAATASGLIAGTYTVTITDINSCSITKNVTITQPPAITSSVTSQTNIACNGGTTGAATITSGGGTGTKIYSWAPSGGTATTATGLAAGVYTVTITDANACTKTQNVSITQPTVLASSVISQTNVGCAGGATGAATIAASGGTPGYTYSWAPSGGMAATATGLAAGTYTITIIDANACTKTQNVTIIQSGGTITSSVSSQTNVSCFGGSNGSATVTPAGGTPGYTYSWAPSGGTAATASGLVAGTYTVTITDANTCTTTQNVTITQPTAITATTSQTNISCNGGANGSATVTPSGGAFIPPTYTYSWAPSGGTAATASGLIAGTYTVTITYINSCSITKNVTITQPPAITSSVTSQTNIACNSGTTGAATITSGGGTGTKTYSWAPSGGTATTATGLAAGVYTVTITDANACTKTQNISLTQPTAITATTSQTNVACNAGTSGSATVTPTGGTPSYTYSWAPSGGTAATASGLGAGTYTVTITDANVCSITKNVTITQPTAITATTSQTNIACNAGTSGSATVTPTGGTPAYTYSWAPSGGTAAIASGLGAGTYTVTITDANVCSITKNVTITQPTAITATTSQTNIACNAGTSGSATVIPTGGTPAYTYAWLPSGGTAATAAGLAQGNYTVTITDANGCTATKNFTLTQPTLLATTGSQTDLSCNGATNGSATVAVTGGTPSYAYSWTPSGGTAATASGLAAGNYTVTVTDANNCSTTKNYIIVQPAAITGTTTQTNVSCNSGTNGSATIIATGGTGALTYSWAPSGGTAATATGLAAGTYTVTITDANTCSITKNVTITQPAILTATGSQVNIFCNGGTNGSATVTAGGGTAPYAYAWTPSGGTAATATGLAQGVYTVTITDAHNCIVTTNFTITQPNAITATTSQINVACKDASTGTATVSVSGGTPAYTYSWAPTGGTAASATALVAGNYTVTITDANSCVETKNITLTEPATALTSTGIQTDLSCNGGANGSATVTAAGGTPGYTYSWMPSGGTAATASGLVAGTYSVIVTDAHNCITLRPFTILQPAAITATTTQTNVSCNGGSNGSAAITATGGTGALTYSWAPSGGMAATATGLIAGTYTVTITDANTCSITKNITVTEPAILTSTGTQVNVSCNGGTNGSATAIATGGTTPYTYVWLPSGGTAVTATGLAQGDHTVTITDANGCITTKIFTITQPNAITAISNQTNVACNGGTSGSASVSAIGGTGVFTYAWTPSGGTAATASGLGTGTYTVTIKDANNCSITKSFTITEPTAITATTSQINVDCNGSATGSATLVPSGGTPGYTYSWAPSGGTAATATGLAAGNYTVIITDANNCNHTEAISISQPTAITATTSQVNVSCNGEADGSATVIATGGTPGYTYDWSPYGGNASTATSLSVGTYTMIITDANNCKATKTVSITEPAVLVATISTHANVSCNAGSDGSATVSGSGGTTPYTYSWAPSGGTAATATGLAMGDYTVTITDAKLCMTTETVSITQPNAVTATTNQTNVSCKGGANGSASVTAIGGTGAYTYAWTPSGGTAATATGLAQGGYTVTITDANNCSITKSFTITEPAMLAASTTQTNVGCNAGKTGSATVIPTGGTPGYTYSWAPSGGTAATATALAMGTYTVTITDANNCSISKTVGITEPTVITITATQENVSCNGEASGSATVTPAGGTPGYTYTWLPYGGTAATVTELSAETYTVIITDANNCSATKTVSITEPDALVATIIAQNNVSCNGGANGSATVSGSGGTTPYTYSWAPSGGTDATATGLAMGTYTVTITDAKSCVTTETVSIKQPNAITAVASQTNVTCNGGTNGVATVTAAGGTGAYMYVWTPSGGTAATATGLAQGGYTITITDANNCSITKSFTITEPAALTATTSQTNVACNNDATASATVNVSGGKIPYTYSWAPSGGMAATASGLVADTYTVTITDANNCTLTKTFTITEPTALSATTTQINVSCNGGTNGSAAVTATGGTGTLSYSWAPSGGTAATATGLVAGTYTCTITDANNCQLTKIVSIIQPSAITATAIQTNVSCTGGLNGSAKVTATGGTGILSYAWAPTGGTANTATGLAAGTYTVTITDANSCSIIQTITITEPVLLIASAAHTNVSCNGGANGSATVTVTGGTNPYTYTWTPTGGTTATATGLIVGSYTCTITDANMCVTIQSVSITEPPVLSATSTKTDILCHGASTGTATVITVGGTTPYTYAWTPAGGVAAMATGLVAGSYTCTITDANNCKYEEKITIAEPAELIITSTQKNIGCNGAADGSASITVTGGFGSYSYAWAPSGGTAATATGLMAGAYTVTVTDGYSCTKTDTINITQPAILAANITKTNVHCHGDSSGVAIVTPTGGTVPYTYTWSAPYLDTDSTLTGLPFGTYTCTVADAHNCKYEAKVVIIEPNTLTASILHNNVSCFGGNNGTATLTANGGTAPYTYAWSPSGGTSAIASGLKAGTYTCTVKDTAGCMTTQTVTVTEPTKLIVSGTASSIACHGGTATVNIFAAGGTAPYTGSGTFTLPAGTHTFIISDNNSCADSVKLDILEPLAITGSQTVSICRGDKLVVGDSTYTASGTYVNVLKAVNSCDSTLTTHLNVNIVDTSVTVSVGVITSNAINANYQWIDCTNGNSIISGATGQSYTVIKSGDYAVVVKIENCSDTSACTHVVATGIDVYSVSDQLNVFPNPSNGTFTIHTTLAGTYTIINELGQTIRSFQLNSSNNYSTTITELNNGTYYVIGINKNQLMRQRIVVVQYR